MLECSEDKKLAWVLRKTLGPIAERANDLPPEFPDCDVIIAPALREIRFCFVHGLDWAVVTLSAALLEYCAKDKAWDVDNPGKEWRGIERLEYFQKHSFDYAIKKCLDGKVLTEEEYKKLSDIREAVRNVVLHMNATELGKDKIYPEMPMLSISTGLIVPFTNVVALDNPIASKFAFWEKINHLAVELIEETHLLIFSMYRETLQKFERGQLGGAVIGKW